jgi:DHA2 family multidrug resistance protein-like MFS transporter
VSDVRDGLPSPQRWFAVTVVALGTVMAVLDGSIANTALPTIARELHVTAAASIWVVNGFQIAVTMTILAFAGIGSARGISGIYRFGIALFTLGSLACALSHSFPLLVTARVVQGVGSAAIMAIAPALNRAIFPRAMLGTALGISAVVVATSAAAGPTIGGTILRYLPWPWLFAINLPIGLFDFFYALRMLPKTPGSGARIDGTSIVLSALGLGGLIYGVDGFARHDAAWLIAAILLASIGALVAFVQRQRVLPQPMLAISLFRSPVFTLSSITSTATYTSQGLAYVALPFFFQSALGRTPFESGLLLTSWPLAVAIVAPIAGRLSDRYSAGLLSTIGLTVMAIGTGLYATLPAHPSTIEIVLHGAICGLGFGFFQSPNNRELLGSAPVQDSASASGILATVRLFGQTLGAALVAIVFGVIGASLGDAHQLTSLARVATPVTLWIACGCASAAAIVSALRLRAGGRHRKLIDA